MNDSEPDGVDAAQSSPPDSSSGKVSKLAVGALFTAAAVVFSAGRLLLGRRVQRDRR